ncbi:MAG: tRNA lysidine(34) synthetase TilS [Candidatus Zixiibacteriota bacterium]|nr:MAG: tRNA lysidine(34) synthetase TilS [candidate division Zixibacteria bacterium]
MSVENKVLETIVGYHMLQRGDSVIVALSGGPDSVALLRLLQGLRARYQLTIRAVYINHNIRKQAARKEEKFCFRLCGKLGVELLLVAEDIPALAKANRQSIEQTARDFRYETFERLANQYEAQRVALGHHVDDRVETVLFRIIRGTGTAGLRGIPPVRGRIVRPLYDLTKEEILAYLRRKRQSYCIDQSNLSEEYDRNFIRNRLLVDIRQKLNPAVDRALLSLSEIAVEDEAFLQEYLLKRIKGIISETVGGKIELDLNKYNRYDKWFRRRLLRYCLAKLSASDMMPERAVVERLDEFCQRGRKSLSLPDGIQAALAGDRAVVYHRGRTGYSVAIEPGKVCCLRTLRLNLRMSVHNRRTKPSTRRRRARVVEVDYEKLVPPFEVRNIRRGDRFRPLGMKGSKRVGDYLTDRKVHPVYRDEIPLVCDSRGVVWLVGFEISDHAKVDSTTRKVLKIGFSRRKES